MKKINCDVVVVGAGPGGSMAAKTCAKCGLDTVLVERKEWPGKHTVTHRGVVKTIFNYVKIDERYFEPVPLLRFVEFAPDGTEISATEPPGYEGGYVVNRKNFDKEILKLALKEGPEYLNKTRATGLIREDGQIKGVKAKIDEREDVEIISNIVIGADGVESKVGRWAGIYERGYGLDDDLSPLFDAVLEDVNIKDEYKYAHCHVSGIPPNIGDWGFSPMGDKKVAITLDPLRCSPPTKIKKCDFINLLNYFIKNNPIFSGGKIVETGYGVEAFRLLKTFIADRVMLVGDAAHQINNPHKAGILNSMEAGEMAGETAVEAHDEGDYSSNILSKYEKRWYRLHGESDLIGLLWLRLLSTMSDERINTFHHAIKENNYIFNDKIFKIFLGSPKFTSKLIYEFKDRGLNINDAFSLFSLFKKHHKVYWDVYFQ